LTCDGKRETYLCGQLEIVDGFPQFTLSRDSQSSANLIHLSQTNALAIIPLGCKSIDAGENVQVLLLSEH
jgi:molybdopterin molybdotransferase